MTTQQRLFDEPTKKPASTKQPAFKHMDQCCLTTGFWFDGEEPIMLDIVPTMKKITHGGHTYNRMPSTYGRDIKTQKTHAVYLRGDYGDRMMVRHGIKTLEEVGCEPPPPEQASGGESG